MSIHSALSRDTKRMSQANHNNGVTYVGQLDELHGRGLLVDREERASDLGGLFITSYKTQPRISMETPSQTFDVEDGDVRS